MGARALLICFVALVGLLLQTAIGQAQATRTWVSGVGDDANPCSRTAPCKTFAGAISKTAVSGEINVLDPGGFGAVTITKSISITSQFEGGVLVGATNGIVVNVAATDKVLLEGLDIEGLGTGLNGVQMIGAGLLTIRRCSIRHFTQNGVVAQGTNNPGILIENSNISNNDGGVSIVGNGAVILDRVQLYSNTTFSTQVNGAGVLLLTGTSLLLSPSAIILSGGGTAISYGNNVLRGAGAPTQTLPLQ